MTEICHYTSAENAIGIFSSQSFKFGHLENSNDPFENLTKRYSISYSVPDYLQNWMDRIFQYANKNLSFASFGTDDKLVPLGEHWTMWAHYGRKHTGVCLVFDESILLKEAKGQNKLFEESKINYTNNLLINPIHFENKIEKSEVDILQEFRKFLLFSKHKAWMAENEYRIVVFDKEFQIPIMPSLNKIIYGPEIQDDKLRILDGLIKAINFSGPVGKLVYAQGNYAKPSSFGFHDLKISNLST